MTRGSPTRASLIVGNFLAIMLALCLAITFLLPAGATARAATA
jgi:hypothetical protein